jgi:Transposase DDE domain
MTKMRHTVDPRQGRLFDPFEGVIPPLGRKRIVEGWQGIFRHVLLELMPARQLGERFAPVFGRPTKELFSVAGLLFLQELNGWTNPRAVEAYLFRTDVQYALNLEPGVDEMCERTFERYRALFVNDELASSIMDEVTTELLGQLELNIDQQRLDSTHVFSNMASFGRTRLMGVAIKRFLTQVKRQHVEDYAAVPEALRERYAPSQAKLFAGEGSSAEGRDRTRQRTAEELHELIVRFAEHPGLKNRPSYKALVTVFEQQCELVEAKVQVRAKTGGACVQNPSDLEATYDGHKGQGYKAQLVETCSESNEVQLILEVLPQTAAVPDAGALKPLLESLEQKDRLPETLLADTAFGGDDNVQMAAAKGVEVVSPVAGRPSDEAPSDNAKSVPPSDNAMFDSAAMEPLTIDDFAVDERTGKVTACPTGRIPLSTIHDVETSKTTVEMPAATCETCAYRPSCPIKKKAGGRYTMSYTAKQRRLEERRREEQTEAFQKRYGKRAGIESTNSGLKRRLGLGYLRVRGKKAVFHALYLKAAGWNLLRAAASGKLVKMVKEAMARFGPALRFWLSWMACLTRTFIRQAISRAPQGALKSNNVKTHEFRHFIPEFCR